MQTKTLQTTALTILVNLAVLSQPGQASTLTPTERVNTVVKWFTGFFDNSAQVANDPSVPYLTMDNCKISAGGFGSPAAQYAHLEQYIGGSSLLRTAAYEFSPSASGVNLSVYGYLDDPAALGACNQASPLLDFSNLEFPSCDISLAYEPSKFFGSNAPEGCSTNFPEPNSRVTSTVTIQADSTVSFDKFYPFSGGSFGQPIRFQRVVATPEPFSFAALLGVSLTGLAITRRHEA